MLQEMGYNRDRMNRMQLNELAARAREHHRAGRLAEAETLYKQMLKHEPYDADLLHMVGLVALQQNDAASAVDWFTRAIRINPANPAFHGNLGMAQKQLGQLERTIESFRKACELRPDIPEAVFNLASALYEAKRIDEAIDVFQKCLKMRPNFAPPLQSLGRIFSSLGKTGRAKEFFEKALQSGPASPDVLTDYACALQTEGYFDEAEAVLRKAVAIDSTYPNARGILGCVLLQRGNFAEGWDLFEARRDIPEVPMHREIQAPLWDGSNFAGKRLLLHEEQGLGDTLQFIRFAPMVKGLGGQVLFMCQRPLLDLLSRQSGIDRITASDTPFQKNEYDLHCPLMSVARLLHTTAQSIPNRVPYIFPEPQLVAKWNSRVGPRGFRRKVGIAWAGNPANAADATRSMPLRLLDRKSVV